MEVRGKLQAGDGSAGTPGFGFRLDPNTGLYRPGTDILAIATAGTERLRIAADGKISTDGGTSFVGDPTAYTPALTAVTANPNLGTSPIQDGWYVRSGRWIHGWASIEFGTGGSVSAGTGAYRVSLPTNMDTTVQGLRVPIGIAFIRDSSASANESGQINYQATGTCSVKREDGADVTNASPWTWATGDEIHFQFSYIAA